jgi:L-aminopeptidase/D-esterase-like protein
VDALSCTLGVMLTDVPGVLVGHWTEPDACTGCTVILLPPGSVASGEVRGGAPGTREFDLLDPNRLVQHVDAVLLAGGSAFGLAAADGVVQWCEEQGRGHPTRFANVPIVVAAVIYDLGVGSATRRPTAADGHHACMAAATQHEVGAVGAGTGATRSKWRGVEAIKPGGIGVATVRSGDLIVSALMVVNPMGDIVQAETDRAVEEVVPLFDAMSASATAWDRQNTTIGVIATNAVLDKRACYLIAQSGHDGIARAVWPSHLSGDGDAIVAVSVPGERQLSASVEAVRALASEAVARAIRSVG